MRIAPHKEDGWTKTVAERNQNMIPSHIIRPTTTRCEDDLNVPTQSEEDTITQGNDLENRSRTAGKPRNPTHSKKPRMTPRPRFNRSIATTTPHHHHASSTTTPKRLATRVRRYPCPRSRRAQVGKEGIVPQEVQPSLLPAQRAHSCGVLSSMAL